VSVEITLVPCNKTHWEPFAKFHYFENSRWERLNPSARMFLAYAEVDGVLRDQPIGFCAALPFPSGTLKNAWRSHKVVVAMEPCREEKVLWSLVSDALAKQIAGEGKRYFCQTPKEYAAYRDSSPNWMPTSSDKRKRCVLQGRRSHEWVP
jgi:hypothetical protein